MSDLDKAIKTLEMKLSRDPGDIAGLHELAGLRLSGGDVDGAIASYSRCITFAPRDAAARNNLGVALIKARRFGDAVAALEAALQALDRAVQLAPAQVEAQMTLGIARESAAPGAAVHARERSGPMNLS